MSSAWRKEHPKEARAYSKRYASRAHANSLKWHYGITMETYNALLDVQQGRCKICGKTPTKYSLHVDHDHKTGKIRGLLCANCNRALGLLGDELIMLEKAVNYLKGGV